MSWKIHKEIYKRIIIIVLCITVCVLTWYFHQILKTGILVTHLYYVPIILAAIWWRKKGIWVAFFLAVVLLASSIFIRGYSFLLDDCVRASIFLVISTLIATLVERIVSAEKQLQLITSQLDKRIKQLNCHYSISRFIEIYNSMDSIFRETVKLLPGSFDTSLVHSARIVFDDQTFVTEGFRESGRRLSSDISVHNTVRGVLEVFLSEKALPSPVNEEDSEFVRSLTERLGKICELKFSESSLRESEAKLRDNKVALEQKTIDLQHILDQLEGEKERIKNNITLNTQNILLPFLRRVSVKESDLKILEMIEKNLVEITSSFSAKLPATLTQREIEVCDMIKNGLSTKEIADLLEISFGTVENHRISIRKKLGIANSEFNLASYLRGL